VRRTQNGGGRADLSWAAAGGIWSGAAGLSPTHDASTPAPGSVERVRSTDAALPSLTVPRCASREDKQIKGVPSGRSRRYRHHDRSPPAGAHSVAHSLVAPVAVELGCRVLSSTSQVRHLAQPGWRDDRSAPASSCHRQTGTPTAYVFIERCALPVRLVLHNRVLTDECSRPPP
jgi:hypothetical protein